MYSRIYGLTYFIFLFLFFLCFLQEKIKFVGNWELFKSQTLLSHYELFLIFFVFIGLRGYVNTDWRAYNLMLTEIDTNLLSIENKFGTEPGFGYLLKVCKILGANYTAFVIISSLIDYLLFYYAFREQKVVFLCFLFYYLFCGSGAGFRLEFNLQRNVKSILFFCISIKYLEKADLKKYILLNVIGALFHITSVIYILLLPVIKNYHKKRVLLIIFMVGLIVFFARIRWITNVLSITCSFIPGRLGSIVYSYVNSGFFASDYGLTIGFLERFFSFILFYWFYSKENHVYFNLMFIHVLIYLFCSEMQIIPSRVGILFMAGYWFGYPKIYISLKKDFKLVFLMILLAYGFLKLVASPVSIVYKYDNLLFNHFTMDQRQYYIQKEFSKIKFYKD